MQLLAKLLKSKDPKDLMKANKLIKRMADDHDKKSIQTSKMKSELELVKNNAGLLVEMLTHYTPGVDPRLEDNEVIQVSLHLTPYLHSINPFLRTFTKQSAKCAQSCRSSPVSSTGRTMN